MANRNQEDYYSRMRRGQHEAWREEDERDYRDYPEYGGGRYGSRYENENEANASTRGGNYDQGRVQYGEGRQPSDQSGSSGRYSGYGDFGRGNYGGGRPGWSGQDRYGQTGYGQAGYGQGNYGQSNSGEGYYGQGNYGQGDFNTGGTRSDSDRIDYASRYGSGEGQQYQQNEQRGEYGGSSRNEDWGAGSSGSRRYGGSQSGRSYGYGPQGYGAQQQGMGQHGGKGPKGYQRSDERIKELVCERLRDDPHIDPSEVTVNVQGGKITLEGTVDSRQTKNAIEDIADQFGTQEVQNNLKVQKQGQQSGESAGRQGQKGASGSDDTTSSKQKQH